MDKKYVYIGIGILILAVVIILAFANGNNPNATGNVILESSDLNSNPDKLTIYFFWGDGCPHCATEKPFLESLKKKYKEKIEVKMFETWKNSDNVDLFQEVANAYGIQVQGVPTTFIGDKNWVGYADYMSPEIEDYVKYCIENKCESPLEVNYEDCDDEEDLCLIE